MNRRTVLASGSIALSSLCAGCLTGADETPTPADTTEDRSVVSVCDVPLTEPDPGSERVVNAWTHNDVPPYDASRPESPDGFGEEAAQKWDEDYLGREMSETPSLEFERRDILADSIRNPFDQSEGYDKYWLAVIDSTARRKEVLKTDLRMDFEESILVLVADCCGSGSVTHRWKRVEGRDKGVHLYGYLERPYVQTSDLSRRHSLLEIERPETSVKGACASLTVAPTKRVHFGAADVPVSLLPAVIGNDMSDPVTATVRITTSDGDVRADESITIEPTDHWRGIGTIGETSEQFTIEVVASEIGLDREVEYAGGSEALGIRVRTDGDVAIGDSSELVPP